MMESQGQQTTEDLWELDVGGERFKTKVSTLKSCSNIFYDIVSEHSCVQADGSLFLDRDGKSFRYILEYCRSGQPPPRDLGAYELDLLAREAAFFGVTSLVELLAREAGEEEGGPSSSSPIIKLNVGGQRFETTLATLTAVPDSMLARMFAGGGAGGARRPAVAPAARDAAGAYFLDRSGALFGRVLDHLRTGAPPPPDLPAPELAALRLEARYYGLRAAEAACARGLRRHQRRVPFAALKLLEALAAQEQRSFPGREGAALNLNYADLSGADLAGWRALDAFRPRVAAVGAAFVGADLRGAQLAEGAFGGADFSRADLRGAQLQKANFQAAHFEGAVLEGAALTLANLEAADLRGADLRGADLRGALLLGADLRGADLGGADLARTPLRNTCLQAPAPPSCRPARRPPAAPPRRRPPRVAAPCRPRSSTKVCRAAFARAPRRPEFLWRLASCEWELVRSGLRGGEMLAMFILLCIYYMQAI